MNFTIHAPKVKPEELHRHLIQTDYFTVVKGSVLFWLQYEDGKNEKFILTDQDKKTLSIPPGVWHGYMALKKDTIMVFYITQKFNPNDEFRKKCDPKEWKLPRKA
ncbi:hypothetical protein A2191_02850 [Candidatus Woesebacteria bacterium RIFOXYA1_FULL_38_9]|nr:MAG: hypothetical protein A2191_02850 [Candidatus Woesebacteria bacterium RIFOXYA1_FULL_38_9]